VFGRNRLPAFEGVPTFIKGGFAGVEVHIRVGLFAPRGTPAPILDRLRTSARSVTVTAEFQPAMAASGNTLDVREGEAFHRFCAEDTARGVRVVQRLGRIEWRRDIRECSSSARDAHWRGSLAVWGARKPPRRVPLMRNRLRPGSNSVWWGCQPRQVRPALPARDRAPSPGCPPLSDV
jgi:hypothetical protein